MNKADILKIDALKQLLQAYPNLELAILVGSRVLNTATPLSDWDIAIRWKKHITGYASLEQFAILKQKITEVVGIHPEKIDLIDISVARLAMRAVVAEDGLVLKGDDTLAWSHFLTQTWGELEDHYWRETHAA